jgi:hypothetical protein
MPYNREDENALRERAELLLTALEAYERSVRARLDNPDSWRAGHLERLGAAEGELPAFRRLVQDTLR